MYKLSVVQLKIPSPIRSSVSLVHAVGAMVLTSIPYFFPSNDNVLAKPTKPSLAKLKTV